MIAKTFQGLEEILAEELTALGANDIQIGRRMVSFSGDKRNDVQGKLLPAYSHPDTETHQTLHSQGCRRGLRTDYKPFRWEDYLDTDKTFAVDAVVFSEEFRHSKFVSYKVKDAIVDYFREKTRQTSRRYVSTNRTCC